MYTLTIFTPTYNRAYILPALYNSLVNQTCKDFVWFVVDDGSADNTEELVNGWIDENRINIVYHKTVNKGKPSATNLSIEECDSKLWVCVDSDDFLAVDAVEILVNDYSKIKNIKNCHGIIGNKHLFNGDIMGGIPFPAKLETISNMEIRYKYKIEEDLLYVYETDILKQYRYPIIDGEKFIGESYLYEKIMMSFYIERMPVYYAEYREDGLTASYLKLHIKSPKGYKLLKEMVMVTPKPLIYRFKGAIMYVAACMLCGDKKIIRSSPCKLLTLMAYFPGLMAYRIKYLKLIGEKD